MRGAGQSWVAVRALLDRFFPLPGAEDLLPPPEGAARRGDGEPAFPLLARKRSAASRRTAVGAVSPELGLQRSESV